MFKNKLLIASDIHGSLSAAQNVIDVFKREEADYLVYLGDLMYHGPRNTLQEDYNPSEVATLFNEISSKIIAVRGNCDSEVDQVLVKFPITAEYQNIPLGKGKLFATHGHIFDMGNIPKSVVVGDIFAFGHIHIPILEKTGDGITILNPGSTALPREGHPPTYAVIEDGKVQIKTFDGAIYRDMDL